jgi:hypothetical protein
MSGGPAFTRHRSHRRSRRVAAVIALAASIVAAGALAWLLVGRHARGCGEAVPRRLEPGDDRGAAAQTSDPTAAAASLEANRKGLDSAALRARLLDVREEDGRRAPAPHRVGLAREKVEDVGASVAALADVVDEVLRCAGDAAAAAVDERVFTRAVRGAGPQQFVEAIALREAD